MVSDFKTHKRESRINFYRQKILKITRENIFILIIFVFLVLIGISIETYIIQLNSIGSKDASIISKLSLNSVIIGMFLGFFLALFGIVWCQKKATENKSKEIAKSYARVFKADIERCKRLFKNKRFDLVKISTITIMKNWLDGFVSISAQLTKEEVQQLTNYYTHIDKLTEYEKKINQHLESMQCGSLKDYPYMKEYRDIISVFTFEVNSLFKIDISLLIEKLDLLCK